MSKEVNKRTLEELVAFAIGAEDPIESLSDDEVRAHLTALGVEPKSAVSLIMKRVALHKNEILALEAERQADRRPWVPRQHLPGNNFSFAARTEHAASEEDLEVLSRLTQPSVDDDAGTD